MQTHLSSIRLAGALLGWVLATTVLAQAPDAQGLSLAEARQLAQTHNALLQQQVANVAAAAADRDQSLGAFLPRVSVSETAVFTNAPLNAFGFLLQQERVTQADFNPATLNDPGDVQNYLTQLEVQVPLVNINGWHYRAAATAGVQATHYQLQYARTMTDYYVSEVYFGIQLAASSRTVLLQAKATLQEVLRYTTDNVAAGYAKRSDELAIRVRLSEVEAAMLRLEDQLAYYQDQLNVLLGAAEGTQWRLTDSLNQATVPTLPPLDFDLGQRADHQAYAQALAARSTATQAAEAGIFPTLNAFGQYGLYDTNPFGASGQNYLVGIQLKWELFTGFERKADVARKQAAYAKTQHEFSAYAQQATTEWAQAWRHLALTTQELERAQLAEAQALEAYRILTDRYQQGLEKTYDLLAAETTLAEQRLRVRKAHYDRYLAQAKLQTLGTPASPFSTQTDN